MNSMTGIKMIQEQAIVKEYVLALSRGQKELAIKIRKANSEFIPNGRWASLLKKELESGLNV